MKFGTVVFLSIVLIVATAFVIGANASASPFQGNIVTAMYNWLVSLFV